jgi:hypothetical protein
MHRSTSTKTLLNIILNIMFYFLSLVAHFCVRSCFGLTPGGGSTVHIYAQTIHRIIGLTRTYIGRTAQLISRRCILNAYSTNIRTEYFNRAA